MAPLCPGTGGGGDAHLSTLPSLRGVVWVGGLGWRGTWAAARAVGGGWGAGEKMAVAVRAGTLGRVTACGVRVAILRWVALPGAATVEVDTILVSLMMGIFERSATRSGSNFGPVRRGGTRGAAARP